MNHGSCLEIHDVQQALYATSRDLARGASPG